MKSKKLIVRFLVEAFVGSVIFVVCLRISLVPVFFLTSALLRLPIMIVSILFSALLTYKAVRYIHRYL